MSKKISEVEVGEIVFSYNLNAHVEVSRVFETYAPMLREPKKFLVVTGLTAPATASYFSTSHA